MIFQYELTVPADTPKATPIKRFCRLTAGTLTKVEIAFPPGPFAMVYVIVKDGLFQLLPLSPDEAFHWDNYIYECETEYEIETFPYELEICGWSPGSSWEHVITFRFFVTPKEGETLTRSDLALITEELNE